MLKYCGSIWECRWFWLSLVRADLRKRYRRSFLGLGWSLLQPIAMTVVLCVVFHGLFDVEIREYAPYLLCGLCFWYALMSVTVGGCNCLYQSENYIRQHPAPVAIYPLRAVLSAGFHFLIGLAIALAATWLFNGFQNLPAIVALAPALIILFVTGWAIAVLTSFANVYFPDTQHLLEVALQLLFYVTPVMYPERLLRDKSMAWLVDYNPLAALIQLIRSPILEGHPASATAYCTAILAALLTLAAAGLVLMRFERRLIFHM